MTIRNSVAPSYINTAARDDGFGPVVGQRSQKKKDKYKKFGHSDAFLALAMDVYGAVCQKGKDFLNVLAGKVADCNAEYAIDRLNRVD